MATTTQVTDFSRDILGRYVCNTLAEALASADTTIRADARTFDVVVIGGGSFGGVLAQHLFTADKARRHRILVLEAGPMTVGEHVQNLPMIGLDVPGPTSIADLRAQGVVGARNEVWGLPWHSPLVFTGLAYCVGGRSLYWGGWAPRPLPEELAGWPAEVVTALTGGGYARAAEQLGSDVTNDFIYGPLQNALRQRLFDTIDGKQVPDALALASLPDHPAVTAGSDKAALAELLGLTEAEAAPLSAQHLRDLLKLEAPLAVQSRAREGFFPANKFSAGPLLIEAARAAFAESAGDDVRKRLMIVPNCHVRQLIADGDRVTAVRTGQGDVVLPAGGVVIIASGTIESTRLALNSFSGRPGSAAIGRGLMTHLRSNLTIRVPRAALVAGGGTSLSAAALLLKGRHTADDGSHRFFHLQITAAGLGAQGANSEAEMWRKIPDIDTYSRFATASDTHVVVTVRGIGETDTDNLGSFVRLDPETDEYGDPRAFVSLTSTVAESDLWTAMDRACDDVALAIADGGAYEVLTRTGFKPVAAGAAPSDVATAADRRDQPGTTHHEAGTLRMGTDPAISATDLNCRLHCASNVYAAGPALFPRTGSPNPMLSGVALARRLAEHLSDTTPFTAEAGFQVLFDGVDTSRWRFAGRGDAALIDGALVTEPGDGLGLSWCTTATPADFTLRLQFRLTRLDDNAGVFVRFPDPTSKGYDNPAWVPVHFGIEAQIDDLARDDGADMHHTGACYGIPDPGFVRQSSRPPGEWNDYEITCQGQTYTISLNGVQTTRVINNDPQRGLPSTPAAPSFIGLQTHTGHVAFRHIRIAVR